MPSRKTSEEETILALAARLKKSVEGSARRSSPEAIHPPKAVSNLLKDLTSIFEGVRRHLGISLVTLRKTGGRKHVDISIIIPVYNKVGYTTDCLESLARHKSSFSFEVIVIDNGSTDCTPQLVGSIPGIRYVRNQENRGFVDACNQGADLAKGRILVFLNNDTVVLNNWLDPLVNRLADPTIGLVGSKMIYPDGRLQEAGSIIFKDGSGHNYGKGQDAKDFAFNFSRDVDYCSGASIAIEKRMFRKLGGFDKRYAPAYYEDTDLAMSVRKSGKRVVYEPFSVLMHIEGGTSGTDTTSGFKRFQPINREKFLKKWSKELNKNHYGPRVNPIRASRFGKPKRMLIVDNIVPEYNRDSGSLRMSQIIKAALKLGYNVTFFADNRVASQPYTSELQSVGVEVVYGEVSPRDFYKRRANLYDVILLSRPLSSIWHIDLCKAYQPKAKLIYDTVDLHFLRIGRQAELENDLNRAQEARDWQKLEYYLMDQADLTLVVSYEEKSLLKKEKPKTKVQILSNINSQTITGHPASFSQRSGLLFIGSYNHTPNRDAVNWFIKEVYPKVKKAIPNLHVSLLGSSPTKAVKSLGNSRVTVPGFIDNIDGYFNQARVFISPLRYGAGVKGKLSQALAFGLPIVSTSVGAEGMHLKDNESCLIADDAEGFAAKVIELYNDRNLWKKIQKNSLAVYRGNFSEKAGLEALKDAVKKN